MHPTSLGVSESAPGTDGREADSVPQTDLASCPRFVRWPGKGIMRTAVAMLLLVCVTSLGCSADEELSAVVLESELQRICEGREFWPGYDPLGVPLAIFDGTSTFLFRHPSPPEGFIESEGVHVFEGRHEAVVANSSARIGGESTATVMLESLPGDGALEGCVALVVHEGFHVFQGTTSRAWGANEIDLFLYPVESGTLLALRRLETEALRRAFASGGSEATLAWSARALELRRERFAQMDPAFRAYERGIETHEGTATYVEYKVAGRAAPDLPLEGFDAEDVRSRAYSTGVAWALLLDAFGLGWREEICAYDTLCLDESWAKVVASSEVSPKACAFTESERSAIEGVAQADAEQVIVRRAERRVQFESAPGWRVVVEADEVNPLWPQGFDPLNVHRVEGGILHSRFLKLGNEAGALEVMGGTALTEAVGAHPLFTGVRSVTVGGLEAEPEVEIQDGRVTLNSPSFRADFSGARLERDGTQITIRIGTRG